MHRQPSCISPLPTAYQPPPTTHYPPPTLGSIANIFLCSRLAATYPSISARIQRYLYQQDHRDSDGRSALVRHNSHLPTLTNIFVRASRDRTSTNTSFALVVIVTYPLLLSLSVAQVVAITFYPLFIGVEVGDGKGRATRASGETLVVSHRDWVTTRRLIKS